MESVEATSAKRLDSVDVMRALAILFMVYCHCTIFLSPVDGPYPGLYFFGNHIVGDFAAAMFLFLVGLSFQISSTRARARGVADKGLKRGAIVFLVGLAFSLVIRGPAAILEWDILTCIGLSLMVLNLAQRASDVVIATVALALFVAAPFLRAWSGYFNAWGGEPGVVDMFLPGTAGMLFDPAADYTPGKNFLEVLQGVLDKGFFPLFPWLLFPLTGFLAGRHGLTNARDRSYAIIGGGLLSAAGGFAIAAAGRNGSPLQITGAFIAPLSFYPNTPAMILVQLGVCGIAFGACRILFDDRPSATRPPAWLDYARNLSRCSLSIYFIHHALIYWPLRTLGALHGDQEKYIGKALSTPVAFGAATLFFALLAVLLPRWHRAQFKYGLEWWLAKATR
jgi:uncharacterized membrane protein